MSMMVVDTDVSTGSNKATVVPTSPKERVNWLEKNTCVVPARAQQTPASSEMNKTSVDERVMGRGKQHRRSTSSSCHPASVDCTPPQCTMKESVNSPAASGVDGLESPSRSVTFNTLEIREYGITLGDHPGVQSGPPITLEWNPHSSYTVSVEAYEEAYENGIVSKRRNVELKLPALVRETMLREGPNQYTQSQLFKATQKVKIIQCQRKFSAASAKLEILALFWENLCRKMNRWLKFRNKPLEPAAVWVQRHKKQMRKKKKAKHKR